MDDAASPNSREMEESKRRNYAQPTLVPDETKFRKTVLRVSLRISSGREGGKSKGNWIGGIAGLASQGVFFMVRYSHRQRNLIQEWR